MITAMSRNTIRLLFCTAFLCSVHTGNAQTVVEKMKSQKQLSHFVQAVEGTELDERLNKKGPFTLFAPSNKAFDALSGSEQYRSQLLLNHVFTGMATERSLKAMDNVTFLSGKTVSIAEQKNEQLSVGSYTLVKTNIMADNGVIHIISGVLQ
ncbi:Uncaracterized surface protein containing fasciclin (FAS1) repeats [Fodinibius salinus]|uniref:Uncaracterized surface protein containing fasciclin (FAS1) repeats n=1 Tax=Fodinibius salinus TaxID=860790 RepID=A0A5D3YQA6_9BACT|nr:fasciclin domain-containing protein [Fodinibius salinus]TYP95229.1 Uncaracterized surface protein containing fasciclin (FAS1) repeats [Fodinibius salinus]